MYQNTSLFPIQSTSFVVTVSALLDSSPYYVSSSTAFPDPTDDCAPSVLSCLVSGISILPLTTPTDTLTLEPFPPTPVSPVPALLSQPTASTDAPASLSDVHTVSNLIDSSAPLASFSATFISSIGVITVPAQPVSTPMMDPSPSGPSYGVPAQPVPSLIISYTSTFTTAVPSVHSASTFSTPAHKVSNSIDQSTRGLPTVLGFSTESAQPIPSLIGHGTTPATSATPSTESDHFVLSPITSQDGNPTETVPSTPSLLPSNPGQAAYVITIHSTTITVSLIPITELQPSTVMIMLEIAIGSVTTTFGGSIIVQNPTLSGGFITAHYTAPTLIPAPAATSPSMPLLTLGPSTYTASSNSEYIIGGQTLRPGASAIEVSGTPISLDPQGTVLVLGGSTTIAETLGLGGYVMSGFDGSPQSTTSASASSGTTGAPSAVPSPSVGRKPADPLLSVTWMGMAICLALTVLVCA